MIFPSAAADVCGAIMYWRQHIRNHYDRVLVIRIKFKQSPITIFQCMIEASLQGSESQRRYSGQVNGGVQLLSGRTPKNLTTGQLIDRLSQIKSQIATFAEINFCTSHLRLRRINSSTASDTYLVCLRDPINIIRFLPDASADLISERNSSIVLNGRGTVVNVITCPGFK